MIEPKNSQRIAGLAAFLILTALIVGYFVLHKPLSPDLAIALTRAFIEVAVAGAILSVAGALGRRVVPLPDEQPLIRLSLQAGLGLGIISLGVLLVGSLGGLRPLLGAGVIVLLAFLLHQPLLGWWFDWRELGCLWQGAGRLGKALAAGIALILFFTLLSALAPVLKFDALVYHLALPYIYLSQGRFVYVPQIMFWGMPQNGEMLYTFAMMLGGSQAAVVLGWLAGVLTLTGLAGYLAERSGITVAWVGAATLVSGFTLASALSWGYVDWLAILFGLLFLIALDRWIRQDKTPDLLLAGVFLGLAMGVKYTAGVLLLGGVAAIVYKRRSLRQIPQALIQLLQFGLAAGLVFLPWMVKNLLATGNPLYPFLFPSGAMSSVRLALYQGGAAWGGWQDTLLLPFRATLLGAEAGPGYSASIGALLLGLGLAAWLTWPVLSEQSKSTLVHAALVSFPAVILWMVLGRFSSYLLQSRLYFAIFPALAVQAGIGFGGLRSLELPGTLPGVRLGRIAGALVVLVLWLNFVEVGVTTLRQSAPQAVLGLKKTDAYLEENLGWYAPAMQALRELPPGSKTLMLWEPRSLNCWPKCEPDEILDRWLRERNDQDASHPRSADEILQAWKQAGYTHLLYYRLGADFIRSAGGPYQESDWQALDDLLARLSVVKDFGNTYTLYSLTP